MQTANARKNFKSAADGYVDGLGARAYSVPVMGLVNAFGNFDFDLGKHSRDLLTEDERTVCNIATD